MIPLQQVMQGILQPTDVAESYFILRNQLKNNVFCLQKHTNMFLN